MSTSDETVPFSVRPARVEDSAALGAIHVASWRAAYRGLFPDDVLAALGADEFGERHRRRLLEPGTPDVRTWVADGPGGCLGFSVGGGARDEDLPAGAGEVYAIYVHPAAVGRGIGRSLFARSLETLHTQGRREVVVWVVEANERARRFYEAAGLGLDRSVPARAVVLKGRFGGRVLDVSEVRMRARLAATTDTPSR